ncbi:MAG: hypothetical protein IJS15_12990 [Victivallales bacterium]|nr:hypothetical protein [Victivallales bacterium]
MTKLLKMTIKFMVSLALLWLSLMLLIIGIRLCLPLRVSADVIFSGLAFIGGLILFGKQKFAPIYIFGHELTHWIVAKMFLRKTGRFRIGLKKGFVEVAGTNVWITLAPYIVPFYLMIVIGAFGLSQLFVYPSPPWATMAFLFCSSLAYAYHCSLTMYAIGLSQSDLKMYGEFFSVSLIIAGNVLFLVLALLMCNGQWRRAGDLFYWLCSWQGDKLRSLWLSGRSMIGTISK